MTTTLAARRALTDALVVACRSCDGSFPRIPAGEPVPGCALCARYLGRPGTPPHWASPTCGADSARTHVGCRGIPHCTCPACF